MDKRTNAYGGSYDVMWAATPTFTELDEFYDGYSNRTVGGTRSRSDQPLNTWVCKYGVETGFSCGTLISKTYRRTTPGASWSATWMRINANAQYPNQTDDGDSGGPVFSNTTAYGVMAASLSDGDAVYMAINYIDTLGVSVIMD